MADDIQTLIDGVLARQLRPLAKAMSAVEAGRDLGRALMAALYPKTGNAHIVGITGVPGGGKSTLIGLLAQTLRKMTGKRVGIVAVDPSSPYSGGAILGDRVRMGELTADDGIFIRAMAGGTNMGGLARSTMDTVDILDASGFDVILVETVGVGQDEVDIMRLVHTVVVVSPPGLGDVFQAIKGGLIETADIHVVSKADKPDSETTARDLRESLGLGRARASQWDVPVILTSAETRTGFGMIVRGIDAHMEYLKDSGEWADRRKRAAEARVLKAAEGLMHARLMALDAEKRDALLKAVEDRENDPYAAAKTLFESL